ncbi:Spy/CpxP family protein refolding chaperone [Thermodesulfobacteriota bacterium]
MMKRLIIISIATILVTSVLSAFAGPGSRGMEPGKKGTHPGISNLGLSEEQSEEIKKLREALMQEIAPLRNQLVDKRAELRLLWEQENPDRVEILTKDKEISGIHAQLKKKLTLHRFDFMDVLTDEQKAKLAEFGKRMDRKKRSDWRHGSRSLKRW